MTAMELIGAYIFIQLQINMRGAAAGSLMPWYDENASLLVAGGLCRHLVEPLVLEARCHGASCSAVAHVLHVGGRVGVTRDLLLGIVGLSSAHTAGSAGTAVQHLLILPLLELLDEFG